MSNICKTVTLRKRSIKNGTMQSFYLDYYPGYRDESTMKVQRHESLGIYIYTKPKNQRERDYNDNMTEKAEAIRCRRFESIVNERYDFFDKESRRGTSLPTSRRRQKRRTPSGRTCTSTLRGSWKASAPSERSPLTSASDSWSSCRQHRRYIALKRNCTPTQLQVIGQPSVPYFTPPIVTTR